MSNEFPVQMNLVRLIGGGCENTEIELGAGFDNRSHVIKIIRTGAGFKATRTVLFSGLATLVDHLHIQPWYVGMDRCGTINTIWAALTAVCQNTTG